MKKRNICTFEFGNGTSIAVAVNIYDGVGDELSFTATLEKAKWMSWVGDETEGRGRLLSFTIGRLIIVE